MMDNIGQPRPRHQYIHIPQPGRRGIMVHNGQYPNGAPYVGATGGMGMGVGMGLGLGGMAGMGMGMGAYPGVNAHISPIYYGPNVSRSTYSDYAGFMGGYSPLSYVYSSPYASLGYGCGMYANYYHPYQRTYYGMTPTYSYSYPAMHSTIIPPSTTTYTTVTNSAVPVPVASTRMTTSTTTVRSPQLNHPISSRSDIQYENRRVAMERGSYNPRRIRPADARPDDPFWCRERTGEWHLRTFYQIENECYPGRWLMDAEHGFLVFHRE